MAVTRRQVVVGAIAACAAAQMTGLAGAVRAVAATTTDVLGSSNNFKPLVGTKFTVAGSLSFPLLSVTDFRLPSTATSPTSPPTGPGYSLVFDTSSYPKLTPGNRTFSHPKLGTWQMFLAPVDARNRAESVINRLR